MTLPRITSCSQSPARRGADWLVSKMEADGSLNGASNLSAYYKTVIALAAAGQQTQSERMLNYIVQRFLRDDGDLDGTGVKRFAQFRIYSHSWLLMSAVIRARWDIVRRLTEFVVRFQDPISGGFNANLGRPAEQDLMTTGVGGIALLWAGRVESALRAGQWVRRLFEAQPDLACGLYTAWNSQTGLVTEFPRECPSEEYMIDATRKSQWYFEYGVGAALCAGLAGATGDRDWLDLGEEFLAATRHCREDVYRQWKSGKIGWGAAWLYRQTGDLGDRAIVEAVHESLRLHQHADGYWSRGDVYSEDYGKVPDFEATSEFVVLLSWMEDILSCTIRDSMNSDRSAI